MDELSSSFDFPDSSPRPVALRQLDAHPVARHQADEVGAEAVGDVGEDPDPVLELDPKHAVRERLDDPTRNEIGGAGHETRLYLKLVAQTATCFCRAPFDLVSTRGPSLVMATVCSE